MTVVGSPTTSIAMEPVELSWDALPENG